MAVASLGVVAANEGFGVTSLTLPVTVDVPRSDPVNGGTLVLIFLMLMDTTGGHSVSLTVSDDAGTDPFYGTCLYHDGLNHYGIGNNAGFNADINPRTGTAFNNDASCSLLEAGLILNPLVNGVNNITIGGLGGIDAALAVAVAYTGLNMPGSFVNAAVSTWTHPFGPSKPYCIVESLDTTHTARTLQWGYNDWNNPPNIGDPVLLTPTAIVGDPGSLPYPDYQWSSGDPGTIIVYGLADVTHGPFWPPGTQIPSIFGATVSVGGSGGWTWGSPDITTIFEEDDVDTGAGFLGSMVIAEQTGFSLPLVSQDISGSWAGIDNSFTFGGAALLVGGPGPSCPIPPPPTSGPHFNHRFRTAD